MVKRAAILCVIVLGLVLVVSGCAQIKAYLNSPAADYICAGEDAKLTADDMLKAIEIGKDLYAGKVGIEQAVAVLLYIKKTGCFARAQLIKAFEVVDAINVAQSAKAVRKLKMAPAPLPEYAPLRVYVK